MTRPKSENERIYELEQARVEDESRRVRAAEKIVMGHPSKIEAKRRSLRDLENTISHSNADGNIRANRRVKKSDLESEISHLEQQLENAKEAREKSRAALQEARDRVSKASAAFTIERDGLMLDDAAARRETDQSRLELAREGHALAERKFAQAEKAKVEAAQSDLEKARRKGATELELERYRGKVTAANLQFEWQQRQELAAFEAEQRTAAITATNQGNLDLARLQGDIARASSELSHGQALEIIKANELADIGRSVAGGEIHRENVTHEVNEDIRKAREMMQMAVQKSSSDTMNAAKLLVIKHLLRKDEMSHAQKIAGQAKADDLDSVAADMAEIARWKAEPKNPETDFEN